MPLHYVPKRSGIHRYACRALYKALLKDIPKTGLRTTDHDFLRTTVQQRFRAGAQLQSHTAVRQRLENGYKSLSLIRKSILDPAQWLARLENVVIEYRSIKQRAANLKQKPKPESRAPRPRIWALPGAKSVLDGPRDITDGRPRVVPHVAGAQGVPFLRYSRNQSPFLSHYLRNFIKTRQRRWDNIGMLEDSLDQAESEDAWDEALEEYCGVPSDITEHGGWTDAIEFNIALIRAYMHQSLHKRRAISIRMLEIRDEEARLKREEDEARIDERRELPSFQQQERAERIFTRKVFTDL